MKTRYFCFLFSALGFAALAQYAINWSTIDGGGGTSTNGQYSLSGTIGQPDAGGPMTNGQYSLTGGFWALPQTVQTEGAPTLTIAPATPGNAMISWRPPTGTNWVLVGDAESILAVLDQFSQRHQQPDRRSGRVTHEVLSPVQTVERKSAFNFQLCPWVAQASGLSCSASRRTHPLLERWALKVVS